MRSSNNRTQTILQEATTETEKMKENAVVTACMTASFSEGWQTALQVR